MVEKRLRGLAGFQVLEVTFDLVLTWPLDRDRSRPQLDSVGTEFNEVCFVIEMIGANDRFVRKLFVRFVIAAGLPSLE